MDRISSSSSLSHSDHPTPSTAPPMILLQSSRTSSARSQDNEQTPAFLHQRMSRSEER
jgi:hypothetical protein